MFCYEDIQWGDDETSVGFNAGDGVLGFNLLNPSTTDGILNLEQTSNVGPDNPGLYLFRVDQIEIIEPEQGKIIIALICKK